MSDREREIVIPTIHMNGTDKQFLIDRREDVIYALGVADKLLAKMAPNGRDYYVKPGAMVVAETQHARRQMALKSLMDELQEEIEEIEKQ